MPRPFAMRLTAAISAVELMYYNAALPLVFIAHGNALLNLHFISQTPPPVRGFLKNISSSRRCLDSAT